MQEKPGRLPLQMKRQPAHTASAVLGCQAEKETEQKRTKEPRRAKKEQKAC
jgi:hypothetical protein